MVAIPSGVLRIEYLNDTSYINEPSYGWLSGEPRVPTEKLQSLIIESDMLSKDRWIVVKPNDSFISIDDVPTFDVVIPSNWNVSGEYISSNGIGYGDDLLINNAIEAELEYTDYTSPAVFINSSGINTIEQIYLPEENFSSYIPNLDPGYFFINNIKSYLYPNKVTLLINTNSNQNIYPIDTDEIGVGHPVYFTQLSESYQTISNELPSYIELVSGSIIEVESKKSTHNNISLSREIVPYSPFVFCNDATQLELSPTTTLMVGNIETTKFKEYTYINTRNKFLFIQNPIDGVSTLTFNKVGYSTVAIHNIDISPITWDAEDRIISIVSGITEPLSATVYMPVDKVNNTECDIPVTINVRDANGVPVSGVSIGLSKSYSIKQLTGENLPLATITEVEISGESLLRLDNLPTDKHIVVNNRAVGLTDASYCTMYIEKQPDLSSYNVVTNTYGSAYLDIVLQPHIEPVSNIQYTYVLSGMNYAISGDTSFEITVERGDIINNVATAYAGEYVSDGYIPKITAKSTFELMNYKNIEVSGYLYGNIAKAYDKGVWQDTKDTYTLLNSIPYSDTTSMILTGALSGEYVILYTEVEPTCL